MISLDKYKDNLLSKTEFYFPERALELFHLQSKENKVYERYLDLLGIETSSIDQISAIPFLPVELFKTFQITSGTSEVQHMFKSSGTTGNSKSVHHIIDLDLYDKSLLQSFSTFYKDPSDYCIMGLIGSLDQNPDSSLIYMVHKLIQLSGHEKGGVYLGRKNILAETITDLGGQKSILFGLTYALMDFSDDHKLKNSNIILIETGGMKGKREELTRMDLHNKLKEGFGIDTVHSEYGMTELLSQAYSTGGGRFKCPPWMQVLIRDINDPFKIVGSTDEGEVAPESSPIGGINIVDLANIYSCGFLCTADIGRTHSDGTFEVLGRMDHSDLRGCNLMIDY